jgi:hypothetical protein
MDRCIGTRVPPRPWLVTLGNRLKKAIENSIVSNKIVVITKPVHWQTSSGGIIDARPEKVLNLRNSPPRRMVSVVIRAKKRSTMLSQVFPVGVK